MKQFLFAVGALALAVAVTVAQDTKPQPVPAQASGKAAQPDAKANPFGVQPGGFTTTARITPAKMAPLEEEFETVEAHRDVRKAYVKAAEVAIKAAEVNFELVSKAGANIAQQELMKARLDVEAAKAQCDIRMAELKEVEVKVKFAKKRLDDAKAAGVRVPAANPFQRVDPKQVDPPPAK